MTARVPPGKALDYGWEKLFLAALSMARSQDSLQERLRRAYTYNLIHLRPENVPAAEAGTLAEIKSRLTSVPAEGDEGTIAATTAVMSEDDARALIEKIVGLYGNAAEALGKQRASRGTG